MGKYPEFPIQHLDRDEFAAALRKGLGRAMLHVRQFGLDEVWDLVLEACLHNQVYDQQIDDVRGEWLFEMFKDSPYLPRFREAILAAIEVETEDRNLVQICNLMGRLAVRGDNEAHQKLKDFVYRNETESEDFDWLGEDDLLFVEGPGGILGLARNFSLRMHANPEYSPPFIDFDDFPEYARILKEYSAKDPAIAAYYQYLEIAGQERFSKKSEEERALERTLRHERIRQEYSLQSILDDARNEVGKYPDRYMQFGQHATRDELEEIYTRLIGETRDPVRTRLLWVFRFRLAPLPHIDDQFIEWAAARSDELRAAAIWDLSLVSDQRIHQLAKSKVEAGALTGSDCDAIRLFVHNYDESDGPLILSALEKIHPERDDAYSLSQDILEVSDKHVGQLPPGLLLWVYENMPCTHCRFRAVEMLDRMHQFSDALRFECQYDCNEDIRAFARGEPVR
jgi:hypothetical protein